MITRAYLLLSVQRALVGRIGNEILGITVEWDWKNIWIRAYIEGAISELQREELDEAETEVWADFSPAETVTVEIIENAPLPLDCVGHIVYLRLGCLVKQKYASAEEYKAEFEAEQARAIENQKRGWEFIVTDDPEHDLEWVMEAWFNNEMLAIIQKIEGEWKTTFIPQRQFCELSWEQLSRIYEKFDTFRREEDARGR